MTPSDDLQTVRFSGSVYEAIKKDIARYSPRETILFVLAKKVQTPLGNVFLGTRGITLDGEAVRRRNTAYPKERFSQTFYSFLKQDKALDQGYRVITIHSHPFSGEGKVGLSPVDWGCMEYDRTVYEREFPGNEFLWLVFNKDASRYDGAVVCPQGIREIDEVTVVGDTFTKMSRESSIDSPDMELYARMLLIPGWDQHKLSGIRIGLVGLGGLGSSHLLSCAAHGVGEAGHLVLIDPDKVEFSNLSRIPYASPRHVGLHKVDVAVEYLKSVRPGMKVTGLKMPLFEEEAQKHLACCDVLLVGVDSDLARRCAMDLSSNFLIPMVDNGAGVTVDEIGGGKVSLDSGQTRIYIPGHTPCLLCNMGLDFEDITRELAELAAEKDTEERAFLKDTGYLEGTFREDLPQPTVFYLNQVVANIGMRALLCYLLGMAPGYHGCHVDLTSNQLIPFKAESFEDCTFCGEHAVLGEGDFFNMKEFMAERENLPSPSFTGSEGVGS